MNASRNQLTRGAARLALAAVAALALLHWAAGDAAFTPGTTERVSVDSAGGQANGGGQAPAISADGRFVAFHSGATNLVAGDTNGRADIFVRDRALGTTERVSLNSAGAQAAGGNSFFVAMSADARFVAFNSHATNLVVGDTNGEEDVFVRDRTLGTTERVSVDSAGTQATGGIIGSSDASISADGRFVAFDSDATNLVAADTNGRPDIFVRDRTLGTTERVSVGPAGLQATGGNSTNDPDISADGRFVAFESDATNLVVGDTNFGLDIFVRDRLNGATERVSLDSADGQANGESPNASISADGRFVAFESNATNLIVGDTNGHADIFVRDRFNGTTERVSLDSAGAEANHFSRYTAISADGRFVAFVSYATNLVAGDTNGLVDVFVRDRSLVTTERVTLDSAGAQASGGDSWGCCAISADGPFVAFETHATNLVAGDTNADTDVFVRFADADGDAVQDAADNCPNAFNPGQENDVHPATPAGDHCEDPEPDGVFDITDNCPDTANEGQENTDASLSAGGASVTGDATGDACDADDDNDGWSDGAEDTIGTEPLDNCVGTPGSGGDAWPPDITMDGYIDTGDIGGVTNWFGEPVPTAPARVNIGPDPPDGFIDTGDIGRVTNLFGRGCS